MIVREHAYKNSTCVRFIPHQVEEAQANAHHHPRRPDVASELNWGQCVAVKYGKFVF
jgi:hypothetical protein